MGFANSALVLYLVHVVSSAKSIKDIQHVRQEENTKACLNRQLVLCQELFCKCSSSE
jgi:hypothetical protein